MAGNPVVVGYLDAAEEEIDAARRLTAPPPNRLAAYHLQQASEKLVKALLVARGIHPTKEHRIDVLLGGLDANDPWRALLEPLDRNTPYATTYRYPSPAGRLKGGPAAAAVLAEAAEIEKLIRRARQEFAPP